jgi:hypothetical protein
MKPSPGIPVTLLLPGIIAIALWVAPARADVVTDWNVTANALVASDVGNNRKFRTLAMVHVAMSDAINTVQNRSDGAAGLITWANQRRARWLLIGRSLRGLMLTPWRGTDSFIAVCF